MDQVFGELQKITDAIRANAVETNLQIHELRKITMEAERILTRLATELIPEPPEENTDPIVYPKELEHDEGASTYHD